VNKKHNCFLLWVFKENANFVHELSRYNNSHKRVVFGVLVRICMILRNK